MFRHRFTLDQMKTARGASTNKNITVVTLLNAFGTVLKKINV